MNIAIIGGFGAPENLNGLKDLAYELNKNLNYRAECFEWNKLDKKIPWDIIIAHSYGTNDAIKFANSVNYCLKLFLLNPVRRGWWLFPPVVCVPFKITNPNCEVTTWHSGFCPPSSKVDKGKNIILRGYGHSDICEAAEVWNEIMREI